MQKLWRGIAAGMASLLGACEDGPATVVNGERQAPTWSSLVYASSDGPVLLDVVGEPFATRSPELGPLVARTLGDAIGPREVRFTLDEAVAPHPNFRVVLVFNPPKALDPNDVCAGAAVVKGEAPKEGRVDVLATFCDRGRLFSSVSGWVQKVSGPDDKRFQQLLGQVARDLFGGP